jgi:hypothetical protein
MQYENQEIGDLNKERVNENKHIVQIDGQLVLILVEIATNNALLFYRFHNKSKNFSIAARRA